MNNRIYLALIAAIVLFAGYGAVVCLDNALTKSDCIYAAEMMETVDKNADLFATNQEYLDAYKVHQDFWLANCTK